MSNLKYISERTHEKWSKSSLIAGDVVIVRVGYPGVAAVVPGDMGKLNAASLVIVRPDPEALDSDFLSYLFNSPWGQAAVAARFVGSAQQVLNTNAVADLEVRLPPLALQRRIIGPLRALDDLIENNRRRVEVLDEMARATYREWFVRFRYPGHGDVPLRDSEIGSIPDGWEVSPLFDVAEVGFGFSFKAKHFAAAGPFPIIRIRDVPGGTTRTYSDEIASDRYRVLDGDILIGMDGEFHLRQWTGGEAWLNQRVARLRPTNGLSARHLMLAITDPIREWNAAISGTTVAHLGKRHLEQIQILIPAQDVLDLASSMFNDTAAQGRALVQASRRLASLRDLLLPRLVTGQVDVADLDLDALTEAAIA